MIRLTDCFKAYTEDQDKAASPAETVARVRGLLEARCAGVLEETRRVDTGRLGIPVFLSVCGPAARDVMPTRKQMGKGASPEQAEASALMELVERFSYFSFWADPEHFQHLSWSEAKRRFGAGLMDISRILQSVGEDLPREQAESVMDLVRWRFHPALDVAAGNEVAAPLDWFKKLNEFNGSSAGNSFEESILQGACELVERHVSALVDREHPALPTLDPASFHDEVLLRLCRAFSDNGIVLLLKDFTLGLPVPTVAALAYDPATFPAMSEIVFTAGTAASPAKAAIRAVTEVAQLAGDFQTGRVYEASGLSKFTSLDQIRWLEQGPLVPLDSLPCVEDRNILRELEALARGLERQGYRLYSVDTSHPDLGVTTNYNFVPGFEFRERTPNRGLGLFVGRMLAEEAPPADAERGLAVLDRTYPGAPYLPFFMGLLRLRQGRNQDAAASFAEAEPIQPAAEERALAAFYQAYAMTQAGLWEECIPHLDRAVLQDPEVKEFFNLRGVARFKLKRYQEAMTDFQAALALDSGSAPDLANLGLCHKFLGHAEEALDYLGTALELDPSLDWARGHFEELLRD
ncbi:YcaO-like family protein [Desulfovibrio aminophilus]|nr:YcaO-like family protein [Desulfovibrio aminophilus]